MKRPLILLAVTMLICTSMAFAQGQGGGISLVSDLGQRNCAISDAAVGLCEVYVVHMNAPGVTASEWAITQPSCLQASFLSDYSPFAVYTGASPFLPSGKTVSYGACSSTPIWVATLSYFCQGLTPPCCVQAVVPHGITGALSAVDCDFNLLPAGGCESIWNLDTFCGCTLGTNLCYEEVVGVHTSTWGQVKSMFQ